MKSITEEIAEQSIFGGLARAMEPNIYVAKSLRDYAENSDVAVFNRKPFLANRITAKCPVVLLPSLTIYRTGEYGIYDLADISGGELTVHTNAPDGIIARSIEGLLGSRPSIQLAQSAIAPDAEQGVTWLYQAFRDPQKRKFFSFYDPSQFHGGPFGNA